MARSRSYIATPPGATIREQLKDRGMSQKEFALRMDLSEKHISRLINGDVQLTPEVAVRLETVLGVPAKFWNTLEAIYREKLVKVEAENAIDEDLIIAKKLPYAEMAKLGWIPETRNVNEKVINLRQFFGVVKLSIIENDQITRIACRRLGITDKADLALIAWVQEAKREARDIPTAPIDIKHLIAMIPEIRIMTKEDPREFCHMLKRILSKCGIVLVFLPHLKGSFLQGASFLDGNKIVVGLTARGKDADIFWFSLFHELGHVILGHIDKAEGTTQSDEEDADRWARDTLIPPHEYAEFINQKDFSERSIIAFSNKQGLTPGIIVGRLQREKIIGYNMMNNLKIQYELS